MRFLQKKINLGPVMGFFCWGLGYLDDRGRRVGCLLHPAVHNGRDLRYLTGYGDKCRREVCLQAKIFNELPVEARRFWLEMTQGLSSFYFSSERANPLFHVLLWGESILEAMFEYASGNGLSCTELVWNFPFLADPKISPRKWKYPILKIIDTLPQREWKDFRWDTFFEVTEEEISSKKQRFWHRFFSGNAFTHLVLSEDAEFADFVRFFLGMSRCNDRKLRVMKLEVDEVIVKAIQKV